MIKDEDICSTGQAEFGHSRLIKIRDGINISIIDTGGDGDVLFLVHGIMMSKAVWFKQIEFFSKQFRVIAVDLYGFGQSMGEFKPYSYELHVMDIVLLLKNLEINSVHLLGWSMGGAIAIVFALTYPLYVDSLVLVDTTPQLIESEEFSFAMSGAEASALLGEIKENPINGVNTFSKMIFPEENCDKEVSWIASIAQNTDINVVMDHFGFSGQLSLVSYLDKITTPTLVVCGELDGICPPSASVFMVEKISGAQLSIISGAGHAPFMTRAKMFNRIVGDFFINQKRRS